MIARPRDVAKFFRRVLDEDVAHADAKSLISDESRATMQHYIKATAGWEAGRLMYGAGLMEFSYGGNNHGVYVRGHEGDTYGFISSQGYAPSLRGSYSLVTNVDNDAPKNTMVCFFMQTVKRVITGKDVSLGCTVGAAQILV